VAEAAGQRRRAGRPRLRPSSNAGITPREEILDAAAGLFVSQGLAATTTRQIADRVGIRQASIYYYFSGKDEILLELLTQSVRPSLQVAATLEARCAAHPAAGLYALALIDTSTLTRAPHNIATLYLLPEAQGDDYASFHAERAELQSTYGRLASAAAAQASAAAQAAAQASVAQPSAAQGALTRPSLSDEELAGTLVMQLVESVIQLRRLGALHDGHAHQIAASCLRLAGLTSADVTEARTAAEDLLASTPAQ
jgi:AcrR family transcriptional regulator